MDDEKERVVRINAPPHEASERGGSRYAFKDERVKLSAAPETATKILTSADFRNVEIEGVINALEQLERRFREGDPMREALTTARRAAAKLFIVTTNGNGLRVIK
jgi:hypothetical protein